MCGICGIISLERDDNDFRDVGKMIDALRHRGPDSNGEWQSENGLVSLGHTRLSIIDIDSRSGQPFKSYDDRYVITFNGEIYNYIELKKECIALGSIFRTESDTEVFIESFRHWGIESFKKFKGMWAAVIYDKTTHKVHISRDFFGIKPLYTAEVAGKLYFASEIKALRALGGFFSEPDEITVKMFINDGILDRGNWTFYKNIKRFPHCSFATIDLNSNSLVHEYQIYWSPFEVSFSKYMDSEENVVKGFKELFERSIKLHCRSDVEVGSCLSGGLDSSSIVALATNLNKNFATFTTKFPDYPEIDESRSALMISQKYGTEQYFAEPRIQDFKEHFDEILKCQDEPYGSTSIFSQYMVFSKIHEQGIKVILDGQGSDEQLGGYLDLTYIALNTFFNRGMYFDWLFEVRNFSINHDRNYFRNILSTIKSKLIKIKKEKLAFKDLVSYKDSDTYESRIAILNPAPTIDIEQYLTYLTFDGNLQQLLRYEDRNSMHFSIESRVPFLEPDLVSYILQIPFKYKFRKGYTKYLLRKAFENELPDEITWQKTKLGFASPEKIIMQELFGKEVDSAGSIEWRKLIVEKWRNLNV